MLGLLPRGKLAWQTLELATTTPTRPVSLEPQLRSNCANSISVLHPLPPRHCSIAVALAVIGADCGIGGVIT